MLRSSYSLNFSLARVLSVFSTEFKVLGAKLQSGQTWQISVDNGICHLNFNLSHCQAQKQSYLDHTLVCTYSHVLGVAYYGKLDESVLALE